MLSRIPIPCPECHRTVKVRIDYIGLRVQCKHCGHPFPIPRTAEVACPECGLSETFRAEDLGRMVRCNRCDSIHEALAVSIVPGPSNPGDAPSATVDRRGPEPSTPGGGPTPGLEIAPRADLGGPDDVVHLTQLAGPVGWPGMPAGAVQAVEGGPPPAVGLAALEPPRRDDGPDRGPHEGRAELVELRAEVESLRIRASEAERLRGECEALQDQARARGESEESLRIQLDAFRSELRRLESEAATLRDGASSVDRLEGELQAAGAEVAQLREDCRQSRAAAAAATGEVEALLAHSSTLQDGLLQALAEIEAHPSERLLPPIEADRLRARLGELETQVAEAMAARRAVEEDAARTLRARESELATLREQLGTLQTQMQEVAELEAEEKRLQAKLAGDRGDQQAAAAEPAASRSSAAGPPGRGEAGVSPRGPGLVVVLRPTREPVATAKPPATRAVGSDRLPAQSAASVSPSQVDMALEQIALRDLPPPREHAPAVQLQPKPAGSPGPPTQPDPATRSDAGRGAPERPESVTGPPIDLDSKKLEANRLSAEILNLMSQGRKKEAESLARQLVELIRTVAGELNPEFSKWTTVVGRLQAEQGDLAGARATFEHKNAIFRDKFGEHDLRYLVSLANSAEALLACGDLAGARALFVQAEEGSRHSVDADHPFAVAIRRRLAGFHVRKPEAWTTRVST